MTIQRALLNLHLYIGLTAALFLLVLCVTGGVMVFEEEIEGVFYPKWIPAQPQAQPLALQALVDKAQQANPGPRVTRILLPQKDGQAHRLMVNDGTMVYVNGYTGELLGKRNLRANRMLTIHRLHNILLLSDSNLGRQITGWATLLLMLLALSGLVLWWPRKLLNIKRGANWRRVNFDLHNVSGFYSSLIVFVMALTGVLMSFEETGFGLIYRVTGEPPKVTPPRFTPQKDAPMLTPDQALSIAVAALPGARPTTVGVYPANAVDFKFPEDRTPQGRSRVYLDPYTGEVQLAQNARSAHPGTKVHNLNRPLHTGDIGGLPTRILWFLACLAVVVQVVTGVLIWWKPRRKQTAQVAEAP